MDAFPRGQLVDNEPLDATPPGHELAHAPARTEGVDGGAHGPALPIRDEMDDRIRDAYHARRAPGQRC
jgi:hypothetical protein